MRSRLSGHHESPIWRTLTALALSVLLHLLIVGGLSFRLPLPDPSQSSIQVALAPVVAPEPAPAISAKPAEPETRPDALPAPEPEPQADPEPQVEMSAVETQELASTPEPSQILPEPEPTPQPVDEDVTPPVEEDVTPPVETEPAEPQDQASSSSNPVIGVSAYIETGFELKQNGKSVGVSHISFKQAPDGTYSLSSTTEATGVLSLFLHGQLIQTSTGLVTEQGLRPAEFHYEMTSKQDKSRRAQFDWQAGELTLVTEKRTKKVALHEGAQDLLSFMYQFVFVPPMERMEIPITNGRKLDIYSYAFEGEEEFMTPVGNLRTVHLSYPGDDGEKTELWLAVDYKYMPVKIRKTEEDGSVIEQFVTNLKTDILK